MRPFEDNTAWRQAMRQAMQQRRLGLEEATHAQWSAQIVAHLLGALPPPMVLALCWPIKREPDVRAVVDRWCCAGRRVALPVVIESAQPLAFREWTPDSVLQADRYGIPTPLEGDWLQPDLILLPLNGFDSAGYRLGYGGGYFDRTLASMQPRPLAVGVGFEINRLPTIRPEVHDQRLDWLVTEAGAVKCGD